MQRIAVNNSYLKLYLIHNVVQYVLSHPKIFLKVMYCSLLAFVNIHIPRGKRLPLQQLPKLFEPFSKVAKGLSDDVRMSTNAIFSPASRGDSSS